MYDKIYNAVSDIVPVTVTRNSKFRATNNIKQFALHVGS